MSRRGRQSIPVDRFKPELHKQNRTKAIFLKELVDVENTCIHCHVKFPSKHGYTLHIKKHNKGEWCKGCKKFVYGVAIKLHKLHCIDETKMLARAKVTSIIERYPNCKKDHAFAIVFRKNRMMPSYEVFRNCRRCHYGILETLGIFRRNVPEKSLEELMELYVLS